MRHADAELQLWLANDRITRERHEADLQRLARLGGESPSLRRRAGQAVIAAGQRLAGDAHAISEPRRLAGRSF
jgi:hypothetical protein